MFTFFFCFFVIGPALATIFWKLRSGVKEMAAPPEPKPYEEQPAGRIHLLEGDQYFDSSSENPYEHPALDWASGSMSCVLATDLQQRPQCQAALVGTVQVLKPAHEKGLVAVILDNKRLAAIGQEPFGLMSGAQMLVDRMIPTQTLRSH